MQTVTGYVFELSKPIGDGFDASFARAGKPRTDTLCVECATVGTGDGEPIVLAYVGDKLARVVCWEDADAETACHYCGRPLTERTPMRA